MQERDPRDREGGGDGRGKRGPWQNCQGPQDFPTQASQVGTVVQMWNRISEGFSPFPKAGQSASGPGLRPRLANAFSRERHTSGGRENNWEKPVRD